MKIYGKEYQKYADARAKSSPTAKNCTNAFVGGGLVCGIAQGLKELFALFLSREDAAVLTSVALIFTAALLTGLGVFDKIAKRAGAGTLVPITGFANAVTAAAIDNKSEGFILGVGAKMFTIAGPVIVYGTAAGAVYGVIYWVIK